MIRTLCTLRPDTKADGTPCLKGMLSRDLITVDDQGNERRFPAGTQLVLSKNVGSYSLLALLDEIDHEARREDFEAARQEAIENPPQVDIPF